MTWKDVLARTDTNISRAVKLFTSITIFVTLYVGTDCTRK